ncbi:uncharacterized protein LOC119182143 [Rhipicephalus microplus]|uniref:uncharacterized protein LOC119182143 n=1 Tax=Rhipicephalus microplus TaxID=6941 RepID=UPI003F6CA467
MTIESNGSNGKTILKLAAKTDNAVRLVRRVANRYQGLKEDNLIRLVNAFVLCHFSYVAAMHNWQRAECDKINVLLRKITKRALGIPIRTRTERLLQLGVHNTLEEIAEAQERAQLARLSSSQTGRHILRELGHSPAEVDEKMRQVPREIRDLITVAPIPRNVHPEHNRGRRRARAATLLKQIHSEEHGVSFVDAAAYRGSRAFSAVVVDSKQQITNCASVHTDDPTVAEQVAIALAILEGEREVIYSDSRSAIRTFERGVISKKALRVLQSGGRDGIKHHVLIWFPAHVGQVQGALPNLNESAHEAARALTDRAGSGQRLGNNGVAENRDAPVTYNEITKYFYLARRLYPLPHPNLNRPQALTLRLLQTDTYPNLRSLHAIYPDVFPNDACPECGDVSTLAHMLWECKAMHTNPNTTSVRWEAALRSSLLADQLWAVQQARGAADRLGLTVPTWESPAAR